MTEVPRAPSPRGWRTIRRDSVIWLMGIGLTLNEFLLEPKIRPEALVFCGLLLGLPGILAANEFAKKLVAAVATVEQQTAPSTEPPK